MKKFLFLALLGLTLGASAQTTNVQLKNQIDTDITNASGAGAITKTKVGNNMKAIVDYITQVITTVENNVATKAPIASPAFTGTPTVPVPSAGTDNGQAAPTSWVLDRIEDHTVLTEAFANGNTANPPTLNVMTVSRVSLNSATYFGDGRVYLPSVAKPGQYLFVDVQDDGEIWGDATEEVYIEYGFGNSAGARLDVYDGDVWKFTRMAYTGANVYWRAELITPAFAGRPYRVWTGHLTQTGTAAPVAKIFENTLPNTINWTRTGTGVYRGTMGFDIVAFLDQKTHFVNKDVVFGYSGTSVLSAKFTRISNTVIQVETFSNGVATDGLMNQLSLEVRVYRDYVYN